MIKNFKLYEGTQYSLGEEVKALFEEYNLGIEKVVKEEFLKSRGPILPHEKNLTEFRVYLNKIITEKSVASNWNEDTVEDSKKSIETGEWSGTVEELLKELEEEASKIGTVEETDYRHNVVFSIFAHKKSFANFPTWGDSNTESNPEFHSYAWQHAAIYAQNLKNSVNLMNELCSSYEEALWNRTDEFGDFLTIYDMYVTTAKELEQITNASYRMYKDSKFFDELRSLIGSGHYDSLMTDFIKLV